MPSRLHSVFVYGTLLAPEVLQTLLNRVPKHVPARLEGYIRHPVKGLVYPGLVAASENDRSSSTSGLLLSGLSQSDMRVLDWFEDDQYTRRHVQVQLEDGTDESTQVYLWCSPMEELHLGEIWSYERFRTENLEWYLVNTVQPCRKSLDELDY